MTKTCLKPQKHANAYKMLTITESFCGFAKYKNNCILNNFVPKCKPICLESHFLWKVKNCIAKMNETVQEGRKR